MECFVLSTFFLLNTTLTLYYTSTPLSSNYLLFFLLSSFLLFLILCLFIFFFLFLRVLLNLIEPIEAAEEAAGLPRAEAIEEGEGNFNDVEGEIVLEVKYVREVEEREEGALRAKLALNGITVDRWVNPNDDRSNEPLVRKCVLKQLLAVKGEVGVEEGLKDERREERTEGPSTVHRVSIVE